MITITRNTLLGAALVLTLGAAPVQARFDGRDEALRLRLTAVIQAEGAPRMVSLDALTRAAKGPHDLALSRAASAALRKVLGDHLAGLLVSSQQGVVSLRGRVSEAADLYRASDLCRALPGVRAVDNGLMTLDGLRLQAPESGPPAPPSSRTFSFVTRDLWGGASMSLDVSRGVVTVRGTISGDGARQWVISRLRSVPGIRALRDEMVARQDSTYDNARLAGVVRFTFAESDELRALVPSLQIAVRSGVVQLAGTVTSNEQRLLAETLALSTRGVLVVSSDLIVVPGGRALARSSR